MRSFKLDMLDCWPGFLGLMLSLAPSPDPFVNQRFSGTPPVILQAHGREAMRSVHPVEGLRPHREIPADRPHTN